MRNSGRMAMVVLLIGILPPLRIAQSAEPIAGSVKGTGDLGLKPDELRLSIERGVDYLKRRQKPEGKWDEFDQGFTGGVTGIVTLALLNSGVKPRDPTVQKALDHLRNMGRSNSTYVCSLQTMVFAVAEPEKYRLLIRENVKWLEAKQVKEGTEKGGWYYGTMPNEGGFADPSNSQFALLALHEAERAGVEVNEQTWSLALDYWKRKQRADGGWGYSLKDTADRSTGSMTAAGVASLIIARGQYRGGDAQVNGGVVSCCGASTEEKDEVERGMQWLASNFSSRINPGGDESRLFYYLYALERAGRLSGQRYIGKHDWYRQGAAFFVSQQDDLNGLWKGHAQLEARYPELASAYALLFLSKGRWPVLISRLKHGADNDWNQHQAALQNLTRYVETRWKRDLTWQSIDIDFRGDKGEGLRVEDLLQSPVIFLSGREALTFTNDQKRLLKEYVQQGGFLFAEACDGQGCSAASFDRAFRDLMKELFPDSQLRKLPPDHAVWFAEEKLSPHGDWPWPEGLDTCCRTSVVYFPRTLSCYWALGRNRRASTYSDAIHRDIAWCQSLGVNVLAYATNRELKFKDELMQLRVAETPRENSVRGVLRMAKIAHAGGANDAASAVPNLLKVVKQQFDMRVDAETPALSLTDERIADYPVLYIHGRRSFSFTPEERKALAEYVKRGGFVCGDAICASPQFVASFRREIEATFDSKLTRIPGDHPMFTQEFRGFNLAKVTLREPQAHGDREKLNALLTVAQPQLEGIEIAGRFAVVFSPNDLSCGLESGASLDCRGYIKEDAARIAVNILLYGLQQ